MAEDEKMLEELYELLSLYFEISIGGGLVKAFDKHFYHEPQLDRVILREKILAILSAFFTERR